MLITIRYQINVEMLVQFAIINLSKGQAIPPSQVLYKDTAMFILTEVCEGEHLIKAVAGNKKALLELLNRALVQAADKGIDHPTFYRLTDEYIERDQLEYKHLVNWRFDKNKQTSFLVTFCGCSDVEWHVTHFPDELKNKTFYLS